jgi:hypothetical protein
MTSNSKRMSGLGVAAAMAVALSGAAQADGPYKVPPPGGVCAPPPPAASATSSALHPDRLLHRRQHRWHWASGT